MKIKPKIEKTAAAVADLHAAAGRRGKAAKKRLWQFIYDIVVAALLAQEETARRKVAPAT